MEINTLIAVFTATTLGIGLVYNIYKVSKFMTELELKPSKEKVEDMIEEKFDNHCPFKDRVEKLEIHTSGFDKYIKEHAEWGLRENAGNRELLQELVLNTKNICNKIGIEYLKKNGN